MLSKIWDETGKKTRIFFFQISEIIQQMGTGIEVIGASK